MAFDMKNTFGNLDTKQKIILVVIVVVIGLILWQVKGLLGSSEPAANFARRQDTKGLSLNNNPTLPMNPAESASAQQSMAPMQQASIKTDGTVAILEKDNQTKYLTALNDLQLLKINKDIAETTQAIASARLATMTAEKNMAVLETKPAPLPVSAYTGALSNPISQDQSIAATNAAQNNAITDGNGGYKVVSMVAMQDGSPTATVFYKDKFYSLSKGMTFGDYTVKNIDLHNNKVVLVKKDNEDDQLVLQYASTL